MNLMSLYLLIEDLKVLIYLNLQMKSLNGNIALDVQKTYQYSLTEKTKLKNQMIYFLENVVQNISTTLN